MNAARLEFLSICEEKKRLLAVYEEAAMAHASSITGLRRTMGHLTSQEFEARYQLTEGLRLRAQMMQEDFDRHIVRHKC
jgi:hypothetical protein